MSREPDTSEPDPASRTMGEISHTNPYTDETAGHLFRRGPTVVADGGRADAEADERRADDEPTNGNGSGTDERTMRDVSHTPPNESEDANRAFERGGRNRSSEVDE